MLQKQPGLKMQGAESTAICVQMQGVRKTHTSVKYIIPKTLFKYSDKAFALCYFPPLERQITYNGEIIM